MDERFQALKKYNLWDSVTFDFGYPNGRILSNISAMSELFSTHVWNSTDKAKGCHYER
ncbi:hypothetical protein [Prevotella koreensis]|uniref:hypothetical protein n=1 Tax=Prevotella koreensis TaxID=2490854 RepID=UPI003FA03A45